MVTEGVNYFAAISTHTKIALLDENNLAMFAKCDTTPETQANTYQKGCLLIRTDTGGMYSNSGTSASPTWTLNNAGVTGPTGPTGAGTGVTGATGPTGPTGP